MSDDDRAIRGLSRRHLLAAVGGIGTMGAVGGLGSAAYLSDREKFPSLSLITGSLDLQLRCDSEHCSVNDDGVFEFTIEDIEPGSQGTERVVLRQTANPGWVWLYSTCPEGDLVDAMTAMVTFDRGCDGEADLQLSGSLREVLNELHLGQRLGDECLSDSFACVEFEWAFPDEPGVAQYKGSTTDFQLRFASEQCRHNEGETPPVVTEPCEGGTHHGISYIEVWGCLAEAPDCDCTRLGKLELSDAYVDNCPDLQTDGIAENHIEEGTYDLPEDDDCVDTGYDIRVTDTRTEDGETIAVAFELLDANGDPGPDLCRVDIKSGSTILTYDMADLEPRSNSTEGLLESATD